MAKLITKFKYLKPNARQSVGGYAKYIATREGVDKITSRVDSIPSVRTYYNTKITKKQARIFEYFTKMQVNRLNINTKKQLQ